MKTCTGCQVAKELSAFGNNRRMPDGKQRRCKTCANASNKAWRRRYPERSNASTKAWADLHPLENAEKSRGWAVKNPERRKASARVSGLRRYNLTPEQYDQLLISQDGRCLLCPADGPPSSRRLDVDHDHVTGKVRGLLCRLHNVGLGHFKDDPASLLKAAQYLTRQRKP